MKRKIRPCLTPYRRLFDVFHQLKGGRGENMVLCTICYKRRKKDVEPYNYSSRRYGAKGRYLGFGYRVMNEYYRVIWIGSEITEKDKLECMDCGWKMRGRM